MSRRKETLVIGELAENGVFTPCEKQMPEDIQANTGDSVAWAKRELGEGLTEKKQYRFVRVLPETLTMFPQTVIKAVLE
jgi:N-dimethylarginine dimethylaminohydrolase